MSHSRPPFVGDEHVENKSEGIAFRYGDYLQPVDWTGWAIRDDKHGATPENLAPILQCL